MRFSIYQESRQGGRSNNEDRTTYCYSRNALLLAVADGMGGHHYGEVAAQIAVQTLADSFRREAQPSLKDPFAFLQNALINTHRAILDYSAKHQLTDSPRTTCVTCVIQDSIAYWAHVGDSRLFLMRAGKVIAQTRDHSRVRLLLEEALITPAQAATHPERNKIYSCLGGPGMPEIDFSRKTPLEHDDVVFLCTDGLWGVTSGEMMAVTLRRMNLLQAIPMLMSQAEIKAGPHGDNLSACGVRWEESYSGEYSPGISTQAMALDEVTTHMDEFGRGATYKTDLSEEEIERAIREIRSAIDKYTP